MNLTDKTISGLIWRFAERCGAQVIQFVVSIILARLLTPEDYGLIGLITVFMSIAMVFAQSGLGQALVQKKDADQKDFSTVFFFSLIVSTLIYFILFFTAPIIADFYEEEQLIKVVRVLGFSIIIGSINSVQIAYVQKTMQFKRFFWSTLSGTIISAIVGILMAYCGYGVWALVAQQIVGQVVNVVVLHFVAGWRPSLVFSFKSAKRLFSFSWKLLCSSLMETTYSNLYSLIIGKFYTKSELGYYNKGKQFPTLIISNINTTVDSVLFPVMSELQDDISRLKATVRRSIKTSTFIIFPMMAGLAAVAEPLTVILLTEKWLPTVPFIQFCCFTFAFMPIHTANLQAIKALGRSDIFLRLEIIKKIIGITILLVTIPTGLYVMMIGRCVATVISSFINAYPNKKLLNYGFFEQMMDILPSMILSSVMCFVVYLLSNIAANEIMVLMLQVIVGVVIYICGSRLFKMESFEYTLNIAKLLIGKKKTSK